MAKSRACVDELEGEISIACVISLEWKNLEQVLMS